MDFSQHSEHDHGYDHFTITPAIPTDSHSMGLKNLDHSPNGDMHAGHDHMGMHGAGTAGGMMHHMAFHFGYNETILFSWWQIDSVWGLVGSMVIIFFLAILYEGLKFYREYLFWKTYNLLEYRPVTGPQRNPENPQERRSAPTTSASPVQYVGEVIHKQPPTIMSLNHLYQTLLHIVQVTVSFMLMLIFMTYNIWLCIAVVLGAAVGYFVFCWKKSVIVDVTEHCH